MFFKRRFLSLILALFLLAGLTSCGGPPEDAGSGPSASDLGQEAQPSDQPEDPSLSQLRRELDEGGYFCGIAFLGNLPDGDPEALPRVIREAGYLEDYPFLETLPKEQIIAYEGSEAYCLVPRDQKATLTVQAFLSNESNHYQGEPGEILYESQDGRPVVLIGNVSDIIPNLLVTLTGADGEKMEYHPALSLCDGTVARPVSPNVYDFSRYQAEDSPISADFLGQWESEDGGVVFSSAGTMSLWSGSSMDQATDQKSGTFYVISNSTQYPAGAVLFELTDDHDTPAFWGIFTLAVDGATLTATHVSGDLLWGKETVLFTQ